MTATKLIATTIPFVMLSMNTGGDVEVGQMSNAAVAILKYGELGLCLVLVVYLMWSNYSLVRALQGLIKDKTAQEERLINAIQAFCTVCRERPCLFNAQAFRTDSPNSIAKPSEND